LVGRRTVFTSTITSSPGPAKISHSRGLRSPSLPRKISVQSHFVMIFISPFPVVALIGWAEPGFGSVLARYRLMVTHRKIVLHHAIAIEFRARCASLLLLCVKLPRRRNAGLLFYSDASDAQRQIGDSCGHRYRKVVQRNEGLRIYSTNRWRQGCICPYLSRRAGRSEYVERGTSRRIPRGIESRQNVSREPQSSALIFLQSPITRPFK
jgi:hypothetical protein